MESEILIYQTEGGDTKIEVRLENENVWLSQIQMATLYQTTKQNISLHLKNIFKESELNEELTVKDYLTVQQEGSRSIKRAIKYHNLDAIISVGYRVDSHRGTQFRIWATHRLKEYLIKGFTLDEERLKSGNQPNYFQELLDRIRDIRFKYFTKNTRQCVKNWYLCTNSTRHATQRTAYQGESFAFKTF